MSVSWSLLGLTTRDTLRLGRGYRHYGDGPDEDLLKYFGIGEVLFDPDTLKPVHRNPPERPSLGGRLPDHWIMLLIKRFKAANPDGVKVVSASDIWDTDTTSPLALPGENPDDDFFLPTVGLWDSDPKHQRLLRYLPELDDPEVVRSIARELGQL
jgi:hypothetical protein